MAESSEDDFPDTKFLASRVIELAGGPEAVFKAVTARVDAANRHWNQDFTIIGRILRAHLFVEYYITAYLKAANPALHNLDGARLSFAQKANLMSPNDRSVAYLIPGIVRLNKIRNRLAHTLQAAVTEADCADFSSCAEFVAMVQVSHQHGHRPPMPTDPIGVLEEFAKFCGSILSAASAPDRKHYAQAFTEGIERRRAERNAAAKQSTTPELAADGAD